MFKLPPFKCRQGLWVILAVLALFALTVGFGDRAPVRAGAHPQRIVSLAPAITEMLYSLGLESRVVGVSSYCNFPPRVKRKPAVGAAVDLNEELVIGLRPDLILSVEGDAGKRERLARLTGARVVVLETRHVADIWAHMNRIGALTGTEAHARKVTAGIQARLKQRAAQLAGRRPAPRVFYMVWDQPLMTAGPDSYLDDLIRLAGGGNVVETRAGGAYPAYSYEALLAANPHYILGPRNLAKALAGLERRYPHLAAVKARHVRTLPDDLISRPGPRVVEALDAVAEALK